MKSIYCQDFYKKVGGYDDAWVKEIVSLYHLPFFTVRAPTIYSAGAQCGIIIRKMGWELDKTTAIYSKQDNEVVCAVFNMEEDSLIKLFVKTKKLKAFI